MGQYHANNYAVMPGAELVAVVDPDLSRRIAAEQEFRCNSYSSVQELLEREEVEAVSVAAPTSRHAEITLALLDAGVHALVEKPLAPTLEEAQEMVRRSRERGLVMQVGHITRFYDAVRLLNQTVAAPYLIEARRLTPHARIRDVGVVLDLMIHDIDIILRLVPDDAEIVDVAVAGHSLENGNVEDVAAAQLLFSNGCIARLLASRAAHANERSLTVFEHDRTVTLDFSRDPHTELSVLRSAGDAGGPLQTDRHVLEEDNPLRRELAHFLARINNDEPPIATAEDDLRSLAVATHLLEHMRVAQLHELEEAFS